MTTIEYYNKNFKKLVDNYDNANMQHLYEIFNKYIFNDDIILDIGFGSGRDLKYIKNITKNIYGLDAGIEFVNHLKKDKFYKNRIALSALPEIDINLFNVNKFNVIISIAVFMHLNKNQISQSIKNIKKKLNIKGKIILSYSTNKRENDERDFYEITKSEITKLFLNENFKEIEFIVNQDSLSRNIEWITQVYELQS